MERNYDYHFKKPPGSFQEALSKPPLLVKLVNALLECLKPFFTIKNLQISTISVALLVGLSPRKPPRQEAPLP